MIFKELKLKGVFEIEPDFKADERGYFGRIYDDKIFSEHGIHKNWVQENESFSKNKGTVRGLHFQQSPNEEAKLVRVYDGEVFFAIVDLRIGSETFGKWDSAIISKENKKMIFMPRGFALGMCALADNCALYYKMDNYYSPESARTIKWDDPDLAISWPVKTPSVISEKDANAKTFKEIFRL